MSAELRVPGSGAPGTPVLDLRALMNDDELREVIERMAPHCVLVLQDGKWLSPQIGEGIGCEAFSGDSASCRACLASLINEAAASAKAVAKRCELGVEESMVAIRVRGEPVAYLLAPPSPERPEVTGSRLEYCAGLISQRAGEVYSFKVLQDTTQKVARASNESELLHAAADAIEKMISGHKSFSIYLRREDGKLRVAESRRVDGATTALEHSPGEGFVGWCGENGKALLVADCHAWGDRKPSPQWVGLAERPRSCLTVPIPGPGQHSQVVFQLYSSQPKAFAYSDISGLEMVGALLVAGDTRLRALLTSQALLGPIPASAAGGAPWDLLHRAPGSGQELSQLRQRLYQVICDKALEILPGLRSCARTFDRGRGELRFVATSGDGWTADILELIYSIKEKSAVSRAYNVGRDFFIEDADNEPYYLKLFPDVKSLYAIPIFVRQQILAVLTVDADSKEVFTEARKAELRGLAEQASSVLEHFALIEDTWLFELEQQCAHPPEMSVKSVCESAVKGCLKLFGVRGCSLFTAELSAGRIDLVASTALEAPQGEPVSYPLGEGLTGWVAKYRKPLRVRDVENEGELNRHYPGAKWERLHPEMVDYRDVRGKQTFLAVPLLVRDELIGVLRFTIKEDSSTFRFSDEVLAVRLASRLALVIKDLQSFQKREHELVRRAAFSKSLLNSLDIGKVCEVILREACEITGSDSGHIRAFESAAGVLNLVAEYGAEVGVLTPQRRLGEGFSGKAAKGKTPVFIDDVQTDPDYKTLLSRRRKGVRIASAAAFPLIVQEQLVGVLVLYSTMRIQFDQVRRAIFEDLAGEAALALKAAAMYRELEGEVRALQTALTNIHKVESRYLEKRSLDELLDALLDGALTVSGADVGTIRLLKDDKWVLRAARRKLGARDLMRLLTPSLPFVKNDFFGSIHRSPRTQVVKEAKTDPEFQKFIASVPQRGHRKLLERIVSVVAVPIRIEGRCLGLIFLVARKPHLLLPSTDGCLKILASYAAVAIEHAAAYQMDAPFALLGRIMEGFLHRMRNQAQSLSGKTEVALHRNAPAELVHEKLLQFKEEVMNLSSVIGDLQVFAQVPGEVLRESVDLRLIVNHAAAYRPREHSGVSVELDHRHPVFARVNRVQIEQALERMVENAYDAMPKGGRLRFAVFAKDKTAWVEIADEGIGMDADLLKRCLVPFATSKPAGSGLGLAVANGLIKANNGLVEIKSAVGKGTTFRISFPLAGGSNAAAAGR